MSFHYQTQPLPSASSWLMHFLPGRFHRFESWASIGVELSLPYLLFVPGTHHTWPRLLAVVGLGGLQLVIFATGSFGFFNLLSLSLVLSAVDAAMLAQLHAICRPIASAAATVAGIAVSAAGLIAGPLFWPFGAVNSAGDDTLHLDLASEAARAGGPVAPLPIGPGATGPGAAGVAPGELGGSRLWAPWEDAWQAWQALLVVLQLPSRAVGTVGVYAVVAALVAVLAEVGNGLYAGGPRRSQRRAALPAVARAAQVRRVADEGVPCGVGFQGRALLRPLRKHDHAAGRGGGAGQRGRR